MKMKFVGCLRFLQILQSVRSFMSVMQQFKSVLVVAACIVVLQACAVAPEHLVLDGVGNDLAGVQVSDELNDLGEGDMAQFRTGILAKFGTITVGRQYNAASGRECKQILDASGQHLLSVACQLPSKQWYVRGSLNTPTNSEQFVSVKTDAIRSLVPVEPQTLEPKLTIEDDKEPVTFRVNLNETLYSFARRTTGNALNWEKIAEYNGIENEHELAVGTVLKIPDGLQNSEH